MKEKRIGYTIVMFGAIFVLVFVQAYLSDHSVSVSSLELAPLLLLLVIGLRYVVYKKAPEVENKIISEEKLNIWLPRLLKIGLPIVAVLMLFVIVASLISHPVSIVGMNFEQSFQDMIGFLRWNGGQGMSMFVNLFAVPLIACAFISLRIFFGKQTWKSGVKMFLVLAGSWIVFISTVLVFFVVLGAVVTK